MPSASDRLADHYIRAYRLCAVYVADAGDVAMVGATHSIAGRQRQIRHELGASIVKHWWCASDEDARAVTVACRSLVGSAEQIAGLVPAIARSFGVGLTPHDVVVERAREAVAEVQKRIAAMKATGELRPVNAAYRKRREDRAALGMKTEPYAAYFRRYTTGMLYTMAGEVRGRTG